MTDTEAAQGALSVARSIPGMPSALVAALGVASPALPLIVEAARRLAGGEQIADLAQVMRPDLDSWDKDVLGMS